MANENGSERPRQQDCVSRWRDSGDHRYATIEDPDRIDRTRGAGKEEGPSLGGLGRSENGDPLIVQCERLRGFHDTVTEPDAEISIDLDSQVAQNPERT